MVAGWSIPSGMGNGPSSGRTLRAPACMAAILVAAVAASIGGANAASSTTVVSATVPSASFVDITNCAPGQASRTSFGTVLPGAEVVTTADCDVEFGSSNDTAMLR